MAAAPLAFFLPWVERGLRWEDCGALGAASKEFAGWAGRDARARTLGYALGCAGADLSAYAILRNRMATLPPDGGGSPSTRGSCGGTGRLAPTTRITATRCWGAGSPAGSPPAPRSATLLRKWADNLVWRTDAEKGRRFAESRMTAVSCETTGDDWPPTNRLLPRAGIWAFRRTRSAASLTRKSETGEGANGTAREEWKKSTEVPDQMSSTSRNV